MKEKTQEQLPERILIPIIKKSISSQVFTWLITPSCVHLQKRWYRTKKNSFWTLNLIIQIPTEPTTITSNSTSKMSWHIYKHVSIRCSRLLPQTIPQPLGQGWCELFTIQWHNFSRMNIFWLKIMISLKSPWHRIIYN